MKKFLLIAAGLGLFALLAVRLYIDSSPKAKDLNISQNQGLVEGCQERLKADPYVYVRVANTVFKGPWGRLGTAVGGKVVHPKCLENSLESPFAADVLVIKGAEVSIPGYEDTPYKAWFTVRPYDDVDHQSQLVSVRSKIVSGEISPDELEKRGDFYVYENGSGTMQAYISVQESLSDFHSYPIVFEGCGERNFFTCDIREFYWTDRITVQVSENTLDEKMPMSSDINELKTLYDSYIKVLNKYVVKRNEL